VQPRVSAATIITNTHKSNKSERLRQGGQPGLAASRRATTSARGRVAAEGGRAGRQRPGRVAAVTGGGTTGRRSRRRGGARSARGGGVG
jgi:hypothetical protein